MKCSMLAVLLMVHVVSAQSIPPSPGTAARKAGDVVIESVSVKPPDIPEVSFELGTLYVPENRAETTSRLIGVGFARFKAEPRSDAYKLGPVRKGDVISLQYVSGKWKDHGILASWNPDEAGSEETSRLAIALPSKGGAPGDTVAVVPPGTVAKPFTYTFPTSRDQVVLRISANSNNTANPGAVVYQVKIAR